MKKIIRLKDLKDGASFKLTPRGVEYELQCLDHKKKTATYTSLKSERTFTRKWGWPVV